LYHVYLIVSRRDLAPAGLEMTQARFPVPTSLSLAANFLFAP
jgi:hypothetical protein